MVVSLKLSVQTLDADFAMGHIIYYLRLSSDSFKMYSWSIIID